MQTRGKWYVHTFTCIIGPPTSEFVILGYFCTYALKWFVGYVPFQCQRQYVMPYNLVAAVHSVYNHFWLISCQALIMASRDELMT